MVVKLSRKSTNQKLKANDFWKMLFEVDLGNVSIKKLFVNLNQENRIGFSSL